MLMQIRRVSVGSGEGSHLSLSRQRLAFSLQALLSAISDKPAIPSALIAFDSFSSPPSVTRLLVPEDVVTGEALGPAPLLSSRS